MTEWKFGPLMVFYLVGSVTLGAVDHASSERDISQHLLVDLDSLRLPLGSVQTVQNQGRYGGAFQATGGSPVVEVTKGRKGLTMNGRGTLTSTFDVGSEITGDSDFTAAVWVYSSRVCVEECLLSWSTRAGAEGTSTQINFGSSEVYGAVNHSWDQINFSGDLSWWSHMGFTGGIPCTGQWHYIVVTYDGRDEKLYLDGVLNNTCEAHLNICAEGRVRVGSSENDRYFSGAIASVQIYDIPLYQAEIGYLYQTGGMPTSIGQWWDSIERHSPHVADHDRSVRYFRARLAAYNDLFAKVSGLNIEHDPLYGELWYRLAQAMERGALARNEVLAAYKKAVLSPHGDRALAKLHVLLPGQDFGHFADRIWREADTRGIVALLLGALHNESAWSSLTTFLTSIPNDRVPIKSVLNSVYDATREPARDVLLAACRDHPVLSVFALSKDLENIQVLSDLADPQGAFQECRRVLPLYGSTKARVTLECKSAEILLASGHAEEAMGLLAGIRERALGTDRFVAAEALYLKGRCHMEMGQSSLAVECFLTVTSEYPEAGKASSAAFLIGYMNMLRGRFEIATSAFEFLTEQYSVTPDSDSARRYLERMDVVNGLFQEVDTRKLKAVLGILAASEPAWPALEIYLNTLPKGEIRVRAVLDLVHDTTRGQEREVFWDACRKTPTLAALALRKDLEAVQTISSEDRPKDALLECRRLLPSYQLDRQKIALEFKMAELLMMSGQSEEAMHYLSGFQEKGRHVDRVVAANALCLKGQCHVELGQPNRALACFLAVTSEYPEARKASSAAFLVGYVNMMRSEFDMAGIAFAYVVERYPNTLDSDKALKYMNRIQSLVAR